jgi:hypothetical protein
MTYRNKHLVIPLAGVLFLGLAATASAQSATGRANSATHSAAHDGRANGDAAFLKTAKAVDTGKDAVARDRSRRAAALASSSAAPVALALAEGASSPAANPEPLTVVLVSGALAGLYRMRRHIA